ATASFFIELHQSLYYRCQHCEFIFLDPIQRPTPVDEKTKYDLHQNNPEDAGYRSFLSPVVEEVKKKVDQHAQGLDFGSGPGPTVSVMLEEMGIRCCNYDPIYQPDVSVLQETYDFITCTEVIEHCFDPLSEIQRMKDMLKPSGFIVLMTLFFDDPADFEHSHYHRDPTHVGFFNRKVFQWIGKHLDLSCTFPHRNVVHFDIQ
ncbi:MAG: class I SAM-dependent methyltransferase, partial [Deltaproteobacteria bacterium]|nr:class I SAM-dependent methyltransferase [Deltaproteobacteria bacterium]